VANSLKLPDFLIVGAMKSGTTTLADYLNLHPKVWIPERELHYFDNEENFSRGPAWYSKKLSEGCPADKLQRAYMGEKTPAYSYLPKCAPRIKELFPRVKLIWIFRNPAQRTHSNYLHLVQKGSELASFRSAIANEESNRRKSLVRGYIERSKYVDHIERFLDQYSLDQMHFMLFENLVASRKEELDKVCAFLGIEPFDATPEALTSNVTTMPANVFSLWITKKMFGDRSLPYRVVRRANYLYAKPKPKMPRDLQEKLNAVFDPYNARLAKLTGLDLSPWARSTKRQAGPADERDEM
jgi:Sulfotransferase domain